jgi:hypothetical protein
VIIVSDLLCLIAVIDTIFLLSLLLLANNNSLMRVALRFIQNTVYHYRPSIGIYPLICP